MKTKQILLSFTLSVLLLACNSSSKKTESTPPNNEKISVPKSIGVSIPKSLQKSSTTATHQKTSDEPLAVPSSMGYGQLVDSVSQLSSTKKNIEIELLVIAHIMNDITQYCAGTPVDTTCTIPKGELTLTFNNELVNEIKEIEPNITGIEGQTQPLDKIEFTQYNETKAFQYAFKIYEDNEKSNSSIQWSKDEKHIRSAYEGYENSKLTFSSSINYDELSNANKKMTVNDSYVNFDGKTEDFHFNITDKGNESYAISANENFEFGKFSSLGELSKKGGYLVFTGEYDGQNFSEKETFDAEGNLLSSSFCDSSITCSFDDPTTWQVSGVEDASVEENFNIDENIDNLENYDYTPLKVTGGNLHGEFYMLLDPALLPQDIGIDDMNSQMIEKALVGNIYNFNGEMVASLYNNNYLKLLDTLVLAEVIFAPYDIDTPVNANATENSTNAEPTYKAVSKADTPTLTVEENNENITVCTTQFEPVCASVEVQCVTTPCEAVEQTFGNLCEVNRNKNATYLRDGEC